MTVEGIRLVHAVPGRVRFKLSELRGNSVRAKELEAELSAIRGIRRVTVNPLTGSVLAFYDPAALESVEFQLAIAAALGIALADAGPDLLTAFHPEFQNGSNPSADSIVPAHQLRTLVPLLLTIFGIRSLLCAERIVYPSWYDYFWFAFGSFSMLNRDSSPKV